MAEPTYRMGDVSIDVVVRCYTRAGHLDFPVGVGPIELPPDWQKVHQVATVTGNIRGTIVLPAVEVRLPTGEPLWVDGIALRSAEGIGKESTIGALVDVSGIARHDLRREGGHAK